MNNNKILTCCALTAALLTASTAHAEKGYLAGFTQKLNQGVANVATGFIEIPKNVINISDEQNILVGGTWGLLRGTAHGVARTLVGAAELISSPIPSSEFASPAYVWERFSEDSRYFGFNLPGYWTSYGPLDDGK